MGVPVVMALVVATMALIALVVFANRPRAGTSRRAAISESDGYVPLGGGDSSGSDCDASDGGGCSDGGGGGDGGGSD